MSTKAFLFSESIQMAPSPREHLIVCAGLFILVVVLSISATSSAVAMVMSDWSPRQG